MYTFLSFLLFLSISGWKHTRLETNIKSASINTQGRRLDFFFERYRQHEYEFHEFNNFLCLMSDVLW
jgi:hypothetical protein